jgi:peptide/nickel transport system substrate-binding protein
MPRLTLPAARRATTLVAAAVLSAGVLAACSGSASTPAATNITTLTTAWPSDVTSLDPANLSTGQDRSLVRNIYQTLELPAFTEQGNGSLKFQGADVKPYLAKSWTIKGNLITYTLRDDVKFHGSGNPLTADDVKWSLGRIWATPGAGDFAANGLQSADQIKVVDPHSVSIEFKKKDGSPTPVTPTLMAIFGQAYTSIVDKKTVEPHITPDDPTGAKWLRENPAGSGPYYLAKRTPGSSIDLAADTTSWAPQPSYKNVSIRITTGSIPSLLRNGTINVGEYGMTNQDVETLAASGLDAVWENTGFFDMFAITSGPAAEVGDLAKPQVRQAIAYALPYDQILKSIVHGRGTKADSIVMPSAPEYSPAWNKYRFDLVKAQQLMAAAGNPKIAAPLYYLQGNVDQTNTAILIKASLAKIGITATLTPETEGGLFDVVDARSMPAKGSKVGPPGLELFNWTAWTDDPKIVVGYWTTTGGINNYSLWSSPEVDKANSDFALKPTSAGRTAAYQKAQQIIADEAPVIPIVNTGSITVVAKGISGVSFTPTGSGRYWTMHPAGQPSQLNAAVIGD